MEITSKRIDAKPRSKYKRYNGYNISSSTDNNGGGSSGGMNLSNVVLLSGRTSQIVQGELGASGDIIAYATKEHDITLPIASTDALGAIKVGSGLTINDGVLSVTGSTGGGTGTVSEWGDIKGTLSNQTDLWQALESKALKSELHQHENKSVLDGITSADTANWDDAAAKKHEHTNKSWLDLINQNLSTTGDVLFKSVKSSNDVIAYSTGNHDITLPIASTDALGAIKVGSGLTINDGVLSVTGSTGGGGTVSEWGDITGTLSAQTDLWQALESKALKSELHQHNNKSVLDTIQQYKIDSWNDAVSKGHTHTNKSVLDTITSADTANWDTAYSQRHSHNNLSVLSGISSTNISNWNTAYSNNHTHSNKTVLDGITTGKTSNWDTAYSQRHTHSNKSTLDGISSSDVSSWDTAYSRSHTHSNKSYLDNINQNLSTTSNVKHSSLTCTGDVIAYSKGTASAPFKYWRPSVNSSGVLSWTNSTSETTPTSVNIKGAKGDKGDPGQDGRDGVDGKDGATFNGGKITNDLNIYKNVAGLTINGYSTSWQGAYIKIVNRALSNYGYAWQNDVGGSSYGSGDLYWQCNNPSGQGSAQVSPWYRVKFFKGNSGSGTCIGAQGAVSNTSDIRCKHRFNDLTNVLEKLDNIQPFYYTWNDDEDKIMCLGLSAQDVKPYFPEFVHQLGENPNTLSSEEPILGLDYATLGAVISIAGTKELKQLIDKQQTEIELLKGQIEELKQLITNK